MTGGHGHVVPRPDGAKARCGGPALCSACAKELAAQQAVTAAAPGQATEVDVNDLPVTPAAAAFYRLCSGWDREALRIPWMLGEKDPRARQLQDCAITLRGAVNGLRRDGDL